MAKGNLSNCLPIVLQYEGGFSIDKRDPGNWTGGEVGKGDLKGTKYGISAEGFPHLDIASLSITDATAIYRVKYWDKVNGEALPAGVDLATFDFGVNSGPARSAKALQAVVGAKVDGLVGSETVGKAVAKDGKATIQALCAKRLSFLHGLKTWATFGGGWGKRVADVEAKGVAMWLRSIGANASVVLAQEATKAKKKADDRMAQGGGLATVGGASAVAQSSTVMLVIILAVAVLGAAFLIWKARQNKARADAYAAAAQEAS